jgi:thymidylate synthase (FAD)
MRINTPWFDEGSSKARLIWVTPNAEEIIAHVARVSNPKNQDNEKFEGLIKYCVKNSHFSIFETAYMCVEVVTPLAIATQLLRHRSMTYQMLSLRYASNKELKGMLDEYGSLYYMPEEARLQDTKNRQNSIFADDAGLTDMMQNTMLSAFTVADMAYNELLNKGIAKEVARLVLPQSAFTRLYVTGSVRSWMTYLNVRDDEGVVQYEHVELARAIKTIFSTQFPTINRAFFGRDPDPRDRQIIELEAEISTLQARLRGTK